MTFWEGFRNIVTSSRIGNPEKELKQQQYYFGFYILWYVYKWMIESSIL